MDNPGRDCDVAVPEPEQAVISRSTTGALMAWDPFGQAVDPGTLAIGAAPTMER